MTQNSFYILHLSTAFVGSLFHLFGILLLSRVRILAGHQTLFIANLASTELIYLLNRSMYNILKIVDKDKHVAMITIDLIVMQSFSIANKLMMLHLILDRFPDIICYLHMRYQLIFTRTRMVKTISALRNFAFVYGIVTALLAV